MFFFIILKTHKVKDFKLMEHHSTDEVFIPEEATHLRTWSHGDKLRKVHLYVAAVVLDCMTRGLHEVLLLVYNRKLCHISSFKCLKLTVFFLFVFVFIKLSHVFPTMIKLREVQIFFIQGNVLMRQRGRKTLKHYVTMQTATPIISRYFKTSSSY